MASKAAAVGARRDRGRRGLSVVRFSVASGSLRFARALVVAWALAWAAISPARATVAITDLRVVADGEDGTSVSFVFSAPPRQNVFILENPDRVVIDVEDARWRTPVGPDRAAGIVSDVRFGQYKPGLSRIVIDCRAKARVANVVTAATGESSTLTVRVEPAGRSQRRANGRRGTDGDAPVVAALGGFGVPAPRPLGAQPQPRRGPPALRVVALDPGHGGVDPGAISPSNFFEKRITLGMAREVRAQLLAKGGYRVVMTRNADVFIPLRKRIAIAREGGAHVFVSLHADMIDDPQVRGLSVYTLSERASDGEAASLADRENKADLIAGLDLRGASRDVASILIDLSQRQTMNDSVRLANHLVEGLRSETLLLPRTHRFAGFAVLKAPDMPSVLIEMGYLSNRADEATLRSSAGRAKLARAISRAIDGYFDGSQSLAAR